MLVGNRQFQGKSEARMSEPDQGAAAAAAAVARPAPASLARQQRLLSLFTADRLEVVRLGNAAEALDLRGGWMASRWRCSWPRSCRARRAWISSISG
jgi:hypothetical protein